jgi:hypothetical protein
MPVCAPALVSALNSVVFPDLHELSFEMTGYVPTVMINCEPIKTLATQRKTHPKRQSRKDFQRKASQGCLLT